ncbi:MAG TPA: hypothetical protein VFI46_17475 [Jiangellaceae bacterium]|nr:hypothetical protein [Jiangellaceae bacterium]
MGREGGDSSGSPESGGEASGGEANKLPRRDGASDRRGGRTHLFVAQHSERYVRQQIIKEYEERTGAALIVVIDALFNSSVTLLEELLTGASAKQPLHVLLSSPGGDGEVAVRLVRAMQARCAELTIIVPDMAKSAATILCLGADYILMSPASDLGPVDPQFVVGKDWWAPRKSSVL